MRCLFIEIGFSQMNEIKSVARQILILISIKIVRKSRLRANSEGDYMPSANINILKMFIIKTIFA